MNSRTALRWWMLASAAAACLSSGCATLYRASDTMCAEIVRYANSVPSGESREVSLTTDWGGLFQQKADVMAAKRCDHGETEAGKVLCRYLMENTSTEFAQQNLRRALGCLQPRFDLAEDDAFSIQLREVRAEALSMLGVRKDVTVALTYSNGGGREPPKLTIVAKTKRGR